MSEEQDQGGFKIVKVNTNVTSPVALVLVMLVEFVMFAFYPFVFLVIIPNPQINMIAGLLITFAFAAVDVLLVYLVFKKKLSRHVIFASALVMVVFMLLFVLGPIGARMYFSIIR